MPSFRPHSFVVLGLLAILILSGCSLAEDITPPPNYQSPTAPQASSMGAVFPLLPPDAAAGAVIYADKCAPCHGSQGLGDGSQATQLPNPPAAIGSPGLAREAIPSAWFAVVTQGNLEKFMPGFSGSLNDQQRWDVLAYVYTLSAPQSQMAAGEQVYADQCAACHGPAGKGDGPQAASAGVDVGDLTDPARLAQISDRQIYQAVSDGVAPGMPGFSAALDETQRWAVASYVRSLSFAPPQAAAPEATGEPGATLTPGSATPPPAVTGTPGAVIGSVSGRVTNGSNGPLPTGLTATLEGYDSSMTPVVSLSAPVGADGSYTFSDVEMPTGRVFIVTVDYAGSTFSSDVAHPSGSTAELSLPVTIYDTSSDAAVLGVERMHVFLDFSTPGVMQVVELFIISNPTDKVIVPAAAGQAVLNFTLPEGASNLQFQDSAIGQRYLATEKGFGDTQPVQPGNSQHQVLFAYDLPYTKKLDLRLPIDLPVKAAVIMLENQGVRLSASGLQDAGQQNVQGMSFHMYTVDNLAAGSSVELKLSGQPSAGGQTGANPITEIMVGVAALAVVLIGSGLWLYYGRRPRPRPEPAAGGGEAAEGGEDADALMDAIAALDDLYRDGKLPQDAYHQRRAELKARLVELIQNKGADA